MVGGLTLDFAASRAVVCKLLNSWRFVMTV